MMLPSRFLLGSAECHQFTELLSCEVHVALWRLPGTFLERVKHIHSFGELGDVQHSML